jgi:hypothetical protein
MEWIEKKCGKDVNNIDIGVDCAFPANDFSKAVIAVGVDYLLKK